MHHASPVLTRCRVTENREHGISCVGDSSPRLTQCAISQNHAPELNGGGLYVENSSPQLIDCQILENTALEGGGLYVTVSLMEMTGCVIAGNTAVERNGGGLYLSLSDPKLTQCRIYENSGADGGGIYCTESSPLITRCEIANNQAREMQSDCGFITGGNGGAVYFRLSKPSFVNCLIHGNAAELKGPGLAGYEVSTVTLIHCTVAGNQSKKYNRASVYCEAGSRATVLNSILWNPGPEFAREAPEDLESYFTVSYSCVQGGWPGVGNLRDYPLFQDPLNGNYRLAAGSPCIDSAKLTTMTAEDLEGRVRPGEDGRVDMGAYESAPEFQRSDYVPPPVVYVRADAPKGGDGTSWDRALSSIGYALWLGPKEIWVAGGTYKESVQMEEGVSIYGGFAGHETALDQRDGTAHATIVDATGTGGAAVLGANHARLDGFTLTGGSFSGVVCSDVNPTLAHCVITGNRDSDHGGLYCERASPVLTGCVITGNTAIGEGSGGGVTCLELSSP
ncbi:MAG TPA: right-handed parallel beta-helix repeat-containing protein, partial [bacterium]|nr:right-handed parallel beta-helix repeat-containing protein [bacterium]